MSELEKRAGDLGAFGATAKGENAGGVDFGADAEQEVVEQEEAVEAQAEVEPEAEPEAEAEEAGEDLSEDDLVRQATEVLRQKAQEAAGSRPQASPEMSEMRGQVQALKDQIVAMGRAQQLEEPEDGYDLSVLDSPEVQAQLRAAAESEDPTALGRAQAIIAQHVLKESRDKELESLKQELTALKQGVQQEVSRQQQRQAFTAGLDATEGLGGVPAALVRQFREAQELESWNSHLASHGSLDGYQPRSILGAFLMKYPQHAATPELMQSGATLLAYQLGAGGNARSGAEQISTTGAGVSAKASPARKTDKPEGEKSPEDEILDAMLNAKTGVQRIAAFRTR